MDELESLEGAGDDHNKDVNDPFAATQVTRNVNFE